MHRKPVPLSRCFCGCTEARQLHRYGTLDPSPYSREISAPVKQYACGVCDPVPGGYEPMGLGTAKDPETVGGEVDTRI